MVKQPSGGDLGDIALNSLSEGLTGAVGGVVSGKATNKDYELFKVGQAENRRAFEDATGVKLPATNSETRKFLRGFAENQGIKKPTLSKKM